MQFIDSSRHRPRSVRAALLALTLAAALAAGVSYLAEAAPPQLVEDGQALFQQRCSACHTIGGGKMVGPDLKGVSTRRDRAWLAAFISAPDRMLAQKDPIATQLVQEYSNVPMPNLGLSEADVVAVLAYLESQGGAAPASKPAQAPVPVAPQTAPAAAGDAALGKALFTGERPLQNGGAACLACHSAAGIGALGGGVLGPDLTAAFDKFGGDAGMAPILAQLPFPTMKPVFENKPLTPEEQANLKAFLQSASVSQRPAEVVGQLAGLAAVGLAVLLVLAQVVWRRRLVSVRSALVRSGKR